MSLWWARKNQLDETQIKLIEDLPLRESQLVLGPPGSGKTNVLLRRAQFVRTQQMPNVMVLAFTRSLTEFLKTGCYDAQGREIFPRACVSTLESWIRSLYAQHDAQLPPEQNSLPHWKAALADGAMGFASAGKVPQYDTLFVDEAQDLMPEEVALLRAWSPVLFLVGDDRQQIYDHSAGLTAIHALDSPPSEHTLPFHYRMAPELCEVADRILVPQGGKPISQSSLYVGPRPGRIEVHGPLARSKQIDAAIAILRDQLRAYADMIEQGDLLGIVVPRKDDRETVLAALDNDEALAGKAQIVRARGIDDRGYDPTLDPEKPIAILTEQGSKGLEFRALHWLFVNELAYYRRIETYYTVVTRAKTSLDVYHDDDLPQILAKAYSAPATDIW